MKTRQADGSMRERAYRFIQRKISSRELAAGAPVSELSIANELGISRTPTREAIRQLAAEGLLEETPGRGAYVPRLSHSDLANLYDLREALELHTVRRLAARTLGDVDIERLHSVTEELAALINALEKTGCPSLNDEQMERFEAADIAFHMSLARLAGNERVIRIINQVRQTVSIFARRHTGHDRRSLQQIYCDHRDILQAILARDPEKAAAILARHIQNSRHERLDQYEQWEREADRAAAPLPVNR
jgi:DNA-binding GntR family transcriptional regulator